MVNLVPQRMGHSSTGHSAAQSSASHPPIFPSQKGHQMCQTQETGLLITDEMAEGCAEQG